MILLVFICFFVLWEVKIWNCEISFSIFLSDLLVGLTPLHLNEKSLAKIWMFSHKLNFFLKNPNGKLKDRCLSKIILDHAVFELLSESTFSLKISLLLN